MRVPFSDQQTIAQKLQDAVSSSGSTLGMNFIPVKRDGLKAAGGSTPFDGLFLSLRSLCHCEHNADHSPLPIGDSATCGPVGLLLALGLKRKQISRLLIYEAVLVSAIGDALGVLIGIGYGKLMLTGLTTLWVEAIVTSFLDFHITARSLVVGYLLGVCISALTIAWAIRKTSRITARRLLSGHAEEATSTVSASTQAKFSKLRAGLFIAGLGLAVMAALPDFGTSLGSEGQAGAFVGAGFLVLTSILLKIRAYLRGGWNSQSIQKINLPLSGWRHEMRDESASTLTIGLMAMASFLIIAMGAFKLTPSEQVEVVLASGVSVQCRYTKIWLKKSYMHQSLKKRLPTNLRPRAFSVYVTNQAMMPAAATSIRRLVHEFWVFHNLLWNTTIRPR